MTCPFAYLEPSTAMTTKTVTFTVNETVGTNAVPIEGAIVTVDGARLKTNSSGQAAFNLPAGTYQAKIKAAGYNAATESVTVSGSNVSKTVTLTAVG